MFKPNNLEIFISKIIICPFYSVFDITRGELKSIRKFVDSVSLKKLKLSQFYQHQHVCKFIILIFLLLPTNNEEYTPMASGSEDGWVVGMLASIVTAPTLSS